MTTVAAAAEKPRPSDMECGWWIFDGARRSTWNVLQDTEDATGAAVRPLANDAAVDALHWRALRAQASTYSTSKLRSVVTGLNGRWHVNASMRAVFTAALVELGQRGMLKL